MKETTIIPRLKFQKGNLPFKVQTFSNFHEEQDDLIEGPHSQDYYEMIWLSKGKGVLHLDMQEYAIGDNTIFCILPGQTHHFNAQSEIEGFVFSFTDDFFKMNEYDFDLTAQSTLHRLFAKDHMMNITREVEEDIKGVVLKMVKEFDNRPHSRPDLIRSCFKVFLICLSGGFDEHAQTAERSREAELVKKFMELLDRHFKEKKMVAEYAEQLMVTSNHLNRVVKKITGISAGHYIRQRVVLEAKRMGRYSDAGMKEIAYYLGFLDIAHFSRFFKTFGGANFTEFKKEGMVTPLHTAFYRA